MIQNGLRRPGRCTLLWEAARTTNTNQKASFSDAPGLSCRHHFENGNFMDVKDQVLQLKVREKGGVSFPMSKLSSFHPGAHLVFVYVGKVTSQRDRWHLWGSTRLLECRRPTAETPSSRPHVASKSGICQESPGQGCNKTTPRK